jgi:uncharacterized protein
MTPHLLYTAEGHAFDTFRPLPRMIEATDIAAGLAKKYRWFGQSHEPYTVAQHSIAVASHFSANSQPLLVLWGLLHDAAEAYLWDCPAPLKPYLLLFDPYLNTQRTFDDIENGILDAVADNLEIPRGIPAAVREADLQERDRERHCLYAIDHPLWRERYTSPEPWEAVLAALSPSAAATRWLDHLNATLCHYYFTTRHDRKNDQ